MKRLIILLAVGLILTVPSWSFGADYILNGGSIVFKSQFQIAHINDLKGDAFHGYIDNQIDSGRAYMNYSNLFVTIIDECTFCDLPAVKVKEKNGATIGWVYRHDLVKVGENAAKKQKKK